MKKTLFDENERHTEDSRNVVNDIDNAIRAIYEKYCKNDNYSVRDIAIEIANVNSKISELDGSI